MYLDLSFVCWIVECHYSCNFFRWNNRLGICTQMRSFMKRLVKWWWWRWWQSRKKGLMRPSQLLSVMQFVASDSLWEEEVVLFFFLPNLRDFQSWSGVSTFDCTHTKAVSWYRWYLTSASCKIWRRKIWCGEYIEFNYIFVYWDRFVKTSCWWCCDHILK